MEEVLNSTMRVVIVADAFPPMRSSAAVQLRDLSTEFVRQGHAVTVLVAAPMIDTVNVIEDFDDITVVRLRSPVTKDTNYMRRLAGEFLMPYAMKHNYRKSALSEQRFDAVIWYSPPIFLGPFIRWLKRQNACPSYLILRDIFPQWAEDMGLISKGPALYFLHRVADYQYRSADIVGVQSPGNLAFFQKFKTKNPRSKFEVLHNWLGDTPAARCSLNLAKTKLKGRRIFVYAGNMGVAQQMLKLLELASSMREHDDIGFLFVGRGSEADHLKKLATQRGLENTLFHDEIDPKEIPDLFKQCDFGMICLDSRHQTHNIPGKFLTYMQAGLPVLASVNPGNDLVGLIQSHLVGRVSIHESGADLGKLALEMSSEKWMKPEVRDRCRRLSQSDFSASAAVEQIVSALSSFRPQGA
jgi:glycosyltransferase involved in cell wall biosynthesis